MPDAKETNSKLPLVIIFGRTNVGKSTLFNCLTEQKKALVSNIEGTTRDSNIGEVTWRNSKFKLIDTGGIIDLKYLFGKKMKTDDIEIKVQQQARDYLKQASLILFVVDSRDGLLPQDKQMALLLKKTLLSTDNIILVVNKVDSFKQRRETAEFNKLALGEPSLISAVTGSGTGDLLDAIVKKTKSTSSMPRTKTSTKKTLPEQESKETINVCIVGKPNVGKSSLINALLGEDRIIVSPTPHTTREPQDIQIDYKDKIINLIDTAGISKRGQKTAKQKRIKNSLEKYSITESLKALNKSDIALLVIDINKDLTHQESKLVEEIIKRNLSFIITANKWDSVKDRDTKFYEEKIYLNLPFARWAPVQFISALTGEKVHKIMDLILGIDNDRRISIPDNALSKFLNKIVKIHRPAKAKGTKHPHIYELKQIHVYPPKFSIRIGSKETIHFSYIRFIENRLREKFGFKGTPVNVIVEKNKRVHGAHDESVANKTQKRKK